MFKETPHSDPFYKREPQERHTNKKAFSYDKDSFEVIGRSNEMLYDSYPKYAEAEYNAHSCKEYAMAYTNTMLNRAQTEDNEIFAKKGMNRTEM